MAHEFASIASPLLLPTVFTCIDGTLQRRFNARSARHAASMIPPRRLTRPPGHTDRGPRYIDTGSAAPVETRSLPARAAALKS
jgi:hypothetical protein